MSEKTESKMLFPMFMPTAFPVMVQEKDTPRSRVKSRKIMVYFVPDSVSMTQLVAVCLQLFVFFFRL